MARFPCYDWSLVFGQHHSPTSCLLGTESRCSSFRTLLKQCVVGTARQGAWMRHTYTPAHSPTDTQNSHSRLYLRHGYRQRTMACGFVGVSRNMTEEGGEMMTDGLVGFAGRRGKADGEGGSGNIFRQQMASACWTAASTVLLLTSRRRGAGCGETVMTGLFLPRVDLVVDILMKGTNCYTPHQYTALNLAANAWGRASLLALWIL